MCGYCGESWAIRFVRQEVSLEHVVYENVALCTYFQESNKLLETIETRKAHEDFDLGIELAFCRGLEFLILKSDQYMMGDLLQCFSLTAKQELERLLQGNKFGLIRELCLNEKADVPFLFSDEYFVKTPENKATLIEKSEHILCHYYDDYLDPKIEEVSDYNVNHFYINFVDVFSALLIVVKYKPLSETLKKLALNEPRFEPAFFCYGLWLQRKAYCCYVKAFPMDDIIENLQALRGELFLYALLSNEISKEKHIEFQKNISVALFDNETASLDQILDYF